MPVVSCVCQDCGKSFYSKETYVPMSRKDIFINERKIKKPLNTWNDWIIHVMNFCENCRIKNTPSQFIEDFEKLSKVI